MSIPTTVRQCAVCGVTVWRSAPLGLCAGCLAVHDAKTRESVLRATLPGRHHAARFGSAELEAWCPDAEARREAEAFAVDPPEGCLTLLLTGPTGAGKSSLAAAVVCRLREREPLSVTWTDVRTVAMARKLHGLGDGEPPIIAAALEADVLVIDDVGKERDMRQDESTEVVRLLDLRHASEPKLTIATTELAIHDPKRPIDLRRAYPAAIARRLAETFNPGPPPKGCAKVIHVRRGQL